MSELIKISKEFKGAMGGVWLGKEVTIECAEDCIGEFIKQNEILEKLTTIESENKYDIAVELLKMDRMNAVEVLDMSGNGPVVYKDWP